VDESRFVRSIWRISGVLHRLERQAAASQNVTPSQLRLLVSLSCSDQGRRVSDVASEQGLDVSTMTRNLAQLEKRGWLQRQAGKQDRRTIEVSLTEAGRQQAGALRQATTALLQRAFSSFHPSDRAERAVALDRVAAALEKLEPPGCH
jgi:DNA-binding MarR family transcriptional regulator